MAHDTHFTVVRGQPDAAELAALTVVLSAYLARVEEPESRVPKPAVWRGGRFRPPVAWSAQQPSPARGSQ